MPIIPRNPPLIILHNILLHNRISHIRPRPMHQSTRIQIRLRQVPIIPRNMTRHLGRPHRQLMIFIYLFRALLIQFTPRIVPIRPQRLHIFSLKIRPFRAVSLSR